MVHGGPILSVWVVTGLAWVHGGPILSVWIMTGRWSNIECELCRAWWSNIECMGSDWTGLGARWSNIECVDHDWTVVQC